MKKIKYIAAAILLVVSASLHNSFAALTVDATFTDPTLDLNLSPLVESTLNTELAKYSNVPELTRGFGNANTYASHAATLRGYQGYDLFAISVGSMVSVQAPNDDPKFYQDVMDEMDTGDVYAGVGVTPLVVQAGLNLGFILDGLYVTFLFGKLHTVIDQGDFRVDHNANIVGGHVSYAVFSEKSILARSLLWRGLTIETGFIHTDNKLEFYNKMDKISDTQTNLGGSGYDVSYEIDPSVNFNIASKSNIIPVEIYTSIRLLWALNIGVGGGFDYVFTSRNDFTLSSAGDVLVTDDGSGTNASGFVGQTGKITVNADTSGIRSDKYREKLLANIGFSIGPVFIDFPMSYYLDNGYALGITAGFAW